jgi:phage terminase large subunit-like protein
VDNLRVPSQSHPDLSDYADSILAGRRAAGKWIYAACARYVSDLARDDLVLDHEAIDEALAFFERLPLVGENTGAAFILHPWQRFVIGQLVGWKWAADGRRRFRLALLQVARGNGKTTLMAGLALWDMMGGEGRRVHVIANNEDQAAICLDTARTMAMRLEDPTTLVRFARIVRPSADCEMTALPALERSLDGLNPSLWIADEAAEFKGRFLTKLLTTGAKRKESLGVVISTPGSNPENLYAELVKQAEAVLSGEAPDDSVFAALFGIDPSDAIGDEGCWPKGNPGLEHGQPDILSLRRAWGTMKRSPMGRSEFTRYHCSRIDENTGGWLDMSLWPGGKTIEWRDLYGRPAWIGLDLSKTLDMSALVVCVPMEDGRVALQGHYWWPSQDVAQRELDYRMPVRVWAAERKLTLTPGREIDYESIRQRLLELRDLFEIRAVGYDAWGSKYLAEQLTQDGVPLMTYRMGISTFGPGCQLWQNLWAGGQLVVGDDPVMRRSCAEAHAQTDRNGNVRPVKSREHCILDPLVAGIIAVHVWGGKRASSYETESFI